MVFAALKDAGQITEFVPEQARIYIAEKRQEAFEAYCQAENKRNTGKEFKDIEISGMAPWSIPIELTDGDQIRIMMKQKAADSLIYMSSGPGATIVTDSSPINSLFYMSDDCQLKQSASETIEHAKQHTSLFFYVKPIANQGAGDLLRLHNDKFSRELDDKIIPLVCKLCPDIAHKVIPLIGSAEERKIQALTAYYNKKFPQG